MDLLILSLRLLASSVVAGHGDPDVVLSWTRLGARCVSFNVPLVCACVERQRPSSCRPSGGEPEESAVTAQDFPWAEQAQRIFPTTIFCLPGHIISPWAAPVSSLLVSVSVSVAGSMMWWLFPCAPWPTVSESSSLHVVKAVGPWTGG